MSRTSGFGERGLSRETRAFLIGSALMGAAQAIPWTLLNLYLDRLGYTNSEIGAVQAADAWGKVLVALPAAFLLAHKRTPPILVASALLAGASYLVLPWLATIGAIRACNLVAGLAWSVHYVAIAPFLYRHATAAQRALVFGLAEAVHTGAAVVGAWVAGRATHALTARIGDETESLAWVVSAGGALALLAAIAYGRIREDSAPAAARAPILPVLVRERGVLARFALPQLVIACGAGLCMPFLGLYFQDRFGLAPWAVANLYSAGQVLMTFGFLVTPFVVRRHGFARSAVAFEVLSIPFFLVLAFTASFPAAVIAFLVRGALMNSATPVLKNFAMRATPEGAREVQNGITQLVNGLGWVVGPRIGGLLLDASGDNYKNLMVTTVAFYAAAAAATFWLLRPIDRELDRATAA